LSQNLKKLDSVDHVTQYQLLSGLGKTEFEDLAMRLVDHGHTKEKRVVELLDDMIAELKQMDAKDYAKLKFSPLRSLLEMQLFQGGDKAMQFFVNTVFLMKKAGWLIITPDQEFLDKDSSIRLSPQAVDRLEECVNSQVYEGLFVFKE